MRRLVNLRLAWCRWRHSSAWDLCSEPSTDGRYLQVTVRCCRCERDYATARFAYGDVMRDPWVILNWVRGRVPRFDGSDLHMTLVDEALAAEERLGVLRLMGAREATARASDTERILAERFGHRLPSDVIRQLALTADAAGITVRPIGG